jgi:hypothetical protein
MKKTEKSANGTSFHNTTITTSINELTRVLGEPSYTGDFSEDKVTVEWICERKNGDVITIYDWKEYRSIGKDEKIEFHLGGHSQLITFNGKEDLVELLNK